MNAVKVIDAPCGAGKNTWALQEMSRNIDTDYIYCTPFLTEIIRVRNACDATRFKEPLPDESTTKLSSFTELLEERYCIAVTHSTFLNADARTIGAMASGKYTLILDEVLDVVTDFNNTHIVENDTSQAVSKGDMELLIEKELISINDRGLVQWTGRSYEGSKFSEVERLAKLKRLYYVRDSLLICVFPPEVFRVLDNVYVMTYRFEGSMLRAYFELFDIPYELASVKKDDAGEYYVCGYDPEIDLQFRRKMKGLITVYDGKYNFNEAQKNTRHMFSSTWWDKRATKADLELLSSYTRNYFKNLHASAKNEDIMWTCPTKHQDRLSRERFLRAEHLTTISDEEFALLDKDTQEARLNCFVPCNMRASNNYSNRWALAYLCNLHYHPDLKGLFVDKNPERIRNGEKAIALDDDEFALSSLIQWICRSRLRNDEPIYLYIPSKRMRNLLLDWLDTSLEEDA